jgi:hypothetical protein
MNSGGGVGVVDVTAAADRQDEEAQRYYSGYAAGEKGRIGPRAVIAQVIFRGMAIQGNVLDGSFSG